MKVVGRSRIDLILSRRGICPSRERAKELILSGRVIVGGKAVRKPSEKFPEDADVLIVSANNQGDTEHFNSGGINNKSDDYNYVSRGYLKIKWAKSRLGFDVTGKVCADIGCSTGGFTQFLIENGAKKVYAIDVGRGVLHYSLRNHPKVVVMEGKDAKKICESDFDEKPDFATVDVSFTSSVPVIRNVKFIPEVLVLVKPNFEVPKRYLKKGILKDKEVMRLALMKVFSEIADIYSVRAGTFSYPTGSSGNIEFFLWLVVKGGKRDTEDTASMVDKIIREAFEFFSF